jgi:hypothetical protein
MEIFVSQFGLNYGFHEINFYFMKKPFLFHEFIRIRKKFKFNKKL